MNNATQPQKYNSINEIRERKEAVLAEMRKDNNEIGKRWRSLFQKSQQKKKGLTVASVISTGTGLIDGFLFVWKIYRKFKKR
ncbi:putative uncharacterized protein [Prevotella sp. CAG:1185]|uniref:hypothetical protein n=1 Tax=uncultured Prevotella sp. TaxID=159272 RepID=UPI000338D578|nr:hypothetical protein [uncultured Prevotella sp.]CCY83172.1 putative uncharacterized protein [Prevotella sp. CAG:1185]